MLLCVCGIILTFRELHILQVCARLLPFIVIFKYVCFYYLVHMVQFCVMVPCWVWGARPCCSLLHYLLFSIIIVIVIIMSSHKVFFLILFELNISFLTLFGHEQSASSFLPHVWKGTRITWMFISKIYVTLSNLFKFLQFVAGLIFGTSCNTAENVLEMSG